MPPQTPTYPALTQSAAIPGRRRGLSIRVDRSLIEAVDRTVARFVHTRRQAPISRNAFICRAIEHELDHLRRSSLPRRRRRQGKADSHGGGDTARAANGLPAQAHGATTL